MNYWVPRNLRDDGMIGWEEVSHYTHLKPELYIKASDVERWLEENIDAMEGNGLHVCVDTLLAQLKGG